MFVTYVNVEDTCRNITVVYVIKYILNVIKHRLTFDLEFLSFTYHSHRLNNLSVLSTHLAFIS